MDLKQLESIELKARGAKGTVGTQASYMELFNDDFEKVKDLIKPKFVNWLDVVGQIDIEMLNYFRDNFNIHPLVIEDINSTNQRLKIEFFSDYIFMWAKRIVCRANV